VSSRRFSASSNDCAAHTRAGAAQRCRCRRRNVGGVCRARACRAVLLVLGLRADRPERPQAIAKLLVVAACLLSLFRRRRLDMWPAAALAAVVLALILGSRRGGRRSAGPDSGRGCLCPGCRRSSSSRWSPTGATSFRSYAGCWRLGGGCFWFSSSYSCSRSQRSVRCGVRRRFGRTAVNGRRASTDRCGRTGRCSSMRCTESGRLRGSRRASSSRPASPDVYSSCGNRRSPSSAHAPNRTNAGATGSANRRSAKSPSALKATT
jgi:hypothetical protein